MKLKIKTKVLLGIIFLFAEFVIIGVWSLYYFYSINNRTELMIRNNYHSVQYSENMIQALDETHTAGISLFLNKMYHTDQNTLIGSFNKFEDNLKLEENNITETGEKDLVQSVRNKYFKYKSFFTKENTDTIKDKVNFYFLNVLPLFNEMKANIFSVSTLNMHSIVQKNDNLNDLVKRIYKNLAIILTICFIITFSLMYNFPNYLLNPIKEITDNINQISKNQFKSRIITSTPTEFKQLVEAFNSMAEKLEQNYQPTIIEKNVAEIENKIDENKLLLNIHSLLSSVRMVLSSMSETNNSETLQKQTAVIKEIEEELTKISK